jgi:cyclopropane-fatty-acyl-phospholipid synthase
LWDLYLCYCEAAFLERHISDVQVVLAKPAWRSDPPFELRPS